MYVLLLVTFLVSSTNAHIGDRIYPIYEIPDDALGQFDFHDGQLRAWRGLLSSPTLRATDFYVKGFRFTGVPDSADLDYQIWLGWNDATNRLYVAMERTDDVFLNSYAGGDFDDLWAHDGTLDILVDGDHSGGDLYLWGRDYTVDEVIQGYYRTGQRYSATAHTPDGRHITYGSGHFFVMEGRRVVVRDAEWMTQPPYADGEGVFGEISNTSVFEGYVTPFDDLIRSSPEESKVSDLARGKIIGLSFRIRDFESRTSTSSRGWRTCASPPQRKTSFSRNPTVGTSWLMRNAPLHQR